MSQTDLSELDATLPDTGGEQGAGSYVLLGMPDVNGSLRGKALQPSRVRDGCAGRDGDDRPPPRPRSGRHADHRLRALRDPLRRGRPRRASRARHPARLSWRPGWSVCLSTPSWRDGDPLRARPARGPPRTRSPRWASSATTSLAAFEYEVRIRDDDGQPLSDGISYSLVEIGRFEGFVSQLVRGLAGARGRSRGRAHRGGARVSSS